MTTPKVTVLYDGGCALCRREIDHYRRLDQADRIRWLDLATTPDAAALAGVDWNTAMQSLHVLDAGGRVHTGVAAFVVIWQELPRWHWLARVVRRIPGLLPVLEWAYRHFARWRWQRRCRDGACGLPPS